MEQAKINLKMELVAWAKRRHKTITAHTKMMCHHFYHYMQHSPIWGEGRQVCCMHVVGIMKFPHSTEEAYIQLYSVTHELLHDNPNCYLSDLAKAFIQCTGVQNPRPLSTTARYRK